MGAHATIRMKMCQKFGGEKENWKQLKRVYHKCKHAHSHSLQLCWANLFQDSTFGSLNDNLDSVQILKEANIPTNSITDRI